MVAFSYCTRSIFSWPRSTCAVPLETTTSLSFFSGSNFTAARLFECNCVVASSDLTAALESGDRSEEHTSELQSRLHLVCRLLLEKKKQYYCDVGQRAIEVVVIDGVLHRLRRLV